MTTPLNPETVDLVVKHLVADTIVTHEQYADDGQTWTETYDSIVYWNDREGFTTQTVYEMPSFVKASRETAARYAAEAMRQIHAMGETAARKLAARIAAS